MCHNCSVRVPVMCVFCTWQRAVCTSSASCSYSLLCDLLLSACQQLVKFSKLICNLTVSVLPAYLSLGVCVCVFTCVLAQCVPKSTPAARLEIASQSAWFSLTAAHSSIGIGRVQFASALSLSYSHTRSLWLCNCVECLSNLSSAS